jgi:hypothetical protein
MPLRIEKEEEKKSAILDDLSDSEILSLRLSVIP